MVMYLDNANNDRPLVERLRASSGGGGESHVATPHGPSVNLGISLDGAVQRIGLPPLPPIDEWLVESQMSEVSDEEATIEEHLIRDSKQSVPSSSDIESMSTKRDMPRLFFRPVQAVIAILLLAAALCASLTMLVTQAINYNKQQTESSMSSGVQTPKKSGSQGAVSRSESVPKSKRNEASAANEGIAGADGDAQPSERAESSESEKRSEMQSDGNLININTADAVTLQRVKGVGPVMAQRIIDYRASVGRFRSVEQLLQVSGVGAKTLERIRGQVTV